jgi:hypothetical protein
MEATAEDPAPPQVEEAGPLDLMNYDSMEALLAPHHHPPQNPASEETPEQRSGEQALESHEVMELQAFSERKEWIMEKIKVGILNPHPTLSPPDYFSEKLLEGMPSIQLFADLDAVRASSPAVSGGLPTRKQLGKWLIEHDKIEKETEIFDSGELKKFKAFTMGQCRSVFLLPFPFFLNDRVCSGLKAEFIPTRYRCHRAYFDDHIRIRQAPTSPAGQVRELRSTRHPFDMGRTTLCRMGGPSSVVVRSASFPLPACEMVSIRL